MTPTRDPSVVPNRPRHGVRSQQRPVLARTLVLALGLAIATSALSIIGSVAHATEARAQVTSPAPSSTRATANAAGASGPAIVHVGFLINDVQDIDLQHNLYQIDFYMWFRWTDPSIDPSKTYELMNRSGQDGTWIVPASDGPVTLADGSFYMRQHMLMGLAINMPLEDYPYDEQHLKIIVEDVDATTARLVYVPDDPAVALASDFSVAGYDAGTPRVEVVEHIYPELGATGSGVTTASRIVVTIPMTRPWFPHTLKIFVPFLLVVLCASLVLLIDPRYVDVRIGLSITSLLTLIALKWMTDGEMPLMDYLGLVDTLYLLAFAFVTLCLAETVFSTWRHGNGGDDVEIARFGRRTFLIAGPVFLTACLFVLLPHLT